MWLVVVIGFTTAMTRAMSVRYTGKHNNTKCASGDGGDGSVDGDESESQKTVAAFNKDLLNPTAIPNVVKQDG